MLQELELQTEAPKSEVIKRAALPVCLCPWLENPYRLVSLMDMLRFLAADFCRASSLIGQLYSRVQHGIIPTPDSWGIIGGELGMIERSCEQLNLPSTLAQITRIKQIFTDDRRGSSIDAAAFARDVMEVQIRMIDELNARMILAVLPSRTNYYESKQPLFGEDVANNFPSTAYDIVEAGKCFALDRSTACVFHLMRALLTIA